MDTDLTEVATADSKYIETCEGSTNGRIEEQSAHRFLIGCLCRSMSLSVSPPIGDYQRCDDDVGLTWSSYWVVHLPSATWNIDQTVITFPHKEPPSPNNKRTYVDVDAPKGLIIQSWLIIFVLCGRIFQPMRSTFIIVLVGNFSGLWLNVRLGVCVHRIAERWTFDCRSSARRCENESPKHQL